MMGTDEQHQRSDALCERVQSQKLTDEEAAELARLTQQLCEAEAAHLAVANERKAQEVAAARAAVERLEAENRQLREYLSEQRSLLIQEVWGIPHEQFWQEVESKATE